MPRHREPQEEVVGVVELGSSPAGSDHWPEIIVSAEDVHNAWWDKVLDILDKAQSRERSKWRRLDDDSVPSL